MRNAPRLPEFQDRNRDGGAGLALPSTTPSLRVVLLVVLLQQVLAVIVAVGGADHGVDVYPGGNVRAFEADGRW